MRHLRLIIVAALAAMLAGTVLAYWLNPPVRLPVLDQGQESPGPGDGKPRMRGLTYTQVENGEQKWTLAAEGARYDEENQVATLDKVRIRFFTEKGGWITLTGNTGSYDQKKNLVIMQGSVRGRTDDGLTLKTERLTYSEEREVVETDALVTISGERFSVTGKGMVVEVPKQKVNFLSQVDSTFVPEGKGPPPGATAEDDNGTS